MKFGRSILINIGPPLLVLLLIGGGLEFIVRVFSISHNVLPPTSVILVALGQNFSSLLPHLLLTLRVLFISFLIGVPVGIILGALLSEFHILEVAFSPYVIVLLTTPLTTVVPLFMMWIGFGAEMRIIIVTMQTIPIVMLNSIAGFQKVEREKLELASSLGGNRIQTFFKIIFPNALPQVFTGAKLGAIFSTIATVSTGVAGAQAGLGNRIVMYAGFVDTDIVYACIILIALIGVTLFYIIENFQNLLVRAG